MLLICRLLKAEVLVVQTPPDLELSEENLEEMRRTLEFLVESGVHIAWEVRPPMGSPIPLEVYSLMEGLDIAPIVDLSRFDAPPMELIYSRIFGGLEPMKDEELKLIDERVRGSAARKVYLCFHGTRMYEDALRYIDIAGLR